MAPIRAFPVAGGRALGEGGGGVSVGLTPLRPFPSKGEEEEGQGLRSRP